MRYAREDQVSNYSVHTTITLSGRIYGEVVQVMTQHIGEHATGSVIETSPDILGGTPVFKGTRVPVTPLLDYLAAGDPLERFLDHFPTVKRGQAITLLEEGFDVPEGEKLERRQEAQ